MLDRNDMLPFIRGIYDEVVEAWREMGILLSDANERPLGNLPVKREVRGDGTLDIKIENTSEDSVDLDVTIWEIHIDGEPCTLHLFSAIREYEKGDIRPYGQVDYDSEDLERWRSTGSIVPLLEKPYGEFAETREEILANAIAMGKLWLAFQPPASPTT